MATYAIGDIQGCFDELQDLLEKIHFDPSQDRLWIAGDLINRGPKSLETLRFIRHLDKKNQIVLGNHDLHLLASWVRGTKIKSKDTLQALLDAEDCDDLCHWLRHQAMLVEDTDLGFIMVHAGVLPSWNIAQIRVYAHELETILRSESYQDFLESMYNHQDNIWHNHLTGLSRLRTLANVFTRIRYCDMNDLMALTEKGPLGSQSKNLIPWFSHPQRKSQDQKIIFGHWATLEGKFLGDYNVFSLDTGCVWGRSLRAMRLEDLKIFEVASRQKKVFK